MKFPKTKILIYQAVPGGMADINRDLDEWGNLGFAVFNWEMCHNTDGIAPTLALFLVHQTDTNDPDDQAPTGGMARSARVYDTGG